MQPIIVTAALGAGTLSIYLIVLAAVGLGAHARAAELIVVPGNLVGSDGRPSPRLRARLDAALAAWRLGVAPRILVSGGVEPGGRDEAAAMARYLTANGVPARAVLQDSNGRDTFETARHAATLLGGRGSVLVATQWFHIPRATLAMQRFGLAPVYGTWPRFAEARDAYSFLREAVGLPYYAFRPKGETGGGHDPARPGSGPAAGS